MASKKEFLDDDFDFDMDMDFDFPGEKPLPPPKNAREAVTRALKDGLSGGKDELLKNPIDDIEKLLDAGMPSSLSNEYSNIREFGNDISKATSEALDAVKKEGKAVAKTLSALTPEGTKLRKLLDKVIGPQEETLRGPSKEQRQADEINTAILGALGAQQEQSSVQDAIRNAMEEKRAATTANLLQSIYAEVKMERSFHYKITNSYYRKSLEIQMKQLYTQKELLELTRTNFSNFKTQLEYIVLNTGLPDVLKIRKSEALSKDFGARARQELVDTLYKKFNPFKAISGKMISAINDTKEGILSGLGMVDMMANQAEMLGNMDMGPNKANMAGTMIAEWLKTNIVGKISEKISGTERGKKAIYNAKSAMMDPSLFIKNMAAKKRSGKLGKYQDMFWNYMSNFTASESKNVHTFAKTDLNGAQIFDGRAHQAIVKVIPGLLSKIHAEIKATRVGGNPEAHELVWDNKTEGFNTTSNMASTAIKNIKNTFKSNYQYYATSLTGLLQEHGGKLNKTELNSINRALVSYLLNDRSTVHPSAIISKPFLNSIQDPKLRTKVGKYGAKVLKAAKQNPELLDDINYYLTSIRKAMPLPGRMLDEWHQAGSLDAAVKMGLATKGENGYGYNKDGIEKIILDIFNSDSETPNPVTPTTPGGSTDPLSSFKDKVRGKYESFKGTIVNGVTNSKVAEKTREFGENVKGRVKSAYNKFKNLDRKSAINFFIRKKADIKDIIEPAAFAKMSQQDIGAANKVIAGIHTIAGAVQAQTDKLMKSAGESGIAGELRSTQNKVDEKIGDFLEFAKKNGYNPQAFKNFLNETKAAAGEINEKRQSSGIATVTGVAFKMATGGTKEEWEQKTKEMYAKALTGGAKFLKELKKERSLDDLKKEYFESEEGKKENGPTFEEWMKKMGYKVKGSTLKKLREKTLSLDRKMAKFLLALPFKVIKGGAKLLWKGKGLPFKGLKFGAKLAGGIAGGVGSQVGHLVGDMFKSAARAGGSVAMSMASNLTQATTSIMTADSLNRMADSISSKMSADEGDKQKGRKGSWMDRLNLFGKKEPKEKEMKSTIKSLSNKGPLWLITGLLGGVFNIIKKIGGSVAGLVSSVVKLPLKLAKAIVGGMAGQLAKLGKDLLGFKGGPRGGGGGRPPRPGGGNIRGVTSVNGSTGAPGGKKGKTSLLQKFIASFRKSMPSWISAITPDWAIKKMYSLLDGVKSFGSKFKKFLAKIPTIASKFGPSVAKKAAVKFGSYIVSAGTGVGAILAAGFALWDLGWIGYYMWADGLSFGNAVCKQILDITPFNQEEKDPFEEDDKEDKEENKPVPAVTAGGVAAATAATATAASVASRPSSSSSPASRPATPSPAASGKAPGSIPPPKSIDGGKFNTSPYIKPNHQRDLGRPANIVGLKPDFRKRLEGFAQEYYQYTKGKKLQVNSAGRTFEDQKMMWEKEAKTKWTGNLAADKAAAGAAGGKFYGFRKGFVGYPNRHPSRPGHLTGEAVDINIGAMPGGSSINANKPTPWLDNMLAKWGLHRPLTAFKGSRGTLERWHIAPIAGAGPIPESGDPEPIDVGSLTGKDKSEIVQSTNKASDDNLATASAPLPTPPKAVAPSIPAVSMVKDSSFNNPSLGTSKSSGGPVINTAAMTAVTTATVSAKTLATPAVANTGSMSVTRQTPMDYNKFDYRELLAKQLEVQTQAMLYLKDIRSKMGYIDDDNSNNPNQKSELGGQDGTTDFPASAINLKRKTEYV